MLPKLDRTRDSLFLGDNQTREGLDDINDRFGLLARNAGDRVQFISDIVPPLKMVAGLSLGLGGAAKLINTAWSGVKDFGYRGYRIANQAKNLSMTTRSWQELTGAMIENGSAREDAEQGIEGLFNRATTAINGDDNTFTALLQQQGIKLSMTKDGVDDVAKLMDDMRVVMSRTNPALQSFFASKAGMSDDMLNYLRLSADQAQRLKDQAKSDGLIFSDKDISNALTFKNQMNQVSAAWDGLKLKSEANLVSGLQKISMPEIK